MIYTKFDNINLSMMGMGAVELPCLNGKNFGTIQDPNDFNIKEIERMYDSAIRNGVNYFETARNYHNGLSEPLIAKVLKKYPRDSYNLAAKFLGGSVQQSFEDQLRVCDVDYFDFYLLQSVKENNAEEMSKAIPYLLEQKKNGRIKHLGFSSHFTTSGLENWLNKYHDCFEFVQIQLNWVDWEFINAKELVNIIRKYNKPIWVMCPLKHGMVKRYFNQDKFSTNWIETSMRFLQSIPEVTVVLNGVSCEKDVLENARIFESLHPTTDTENRNLISIAKNISGYGCINCGYCLSKCPQKINIPFIIQNSMPDETIKRCIGCKQCEKICTQQIHITEIFNRLSGQN